MTSNKIHVYQQLDKPPFIIEVGGTQKYRGDTLSELVHNLAYAYGNLYGHLKAMHEERKKMYASLRAPQRKPRASGLARGSNKLGARHRSR